MALGRINQELVAQVKQANNIVDVISETVKLEKVNGTVYRGLCPFPHGEVDGKPVYDTNPSLFVYTDSESYYCFACGHGSKEVGAGSDVIAWVQDYYGMTFTEAVEYLARRAGISIDSVEQEDEEVVRTKKELVARNKQMYLDLMADNEALSYLIDKRGLTKETIKAYRLGLYNGKHGRCIAIPILEHVTKQCLGFAYRNVDGGEPKYINDRSSPLFQKGSILFGLAQVLDDVRKSREVVVVEGYFDVMLLRQCGISTVASMGSVLTEQQVQLLSRYCKSVILFPDGDVAGETSVQRHLPLLLKHGLRVRVSFVPGKDPDEVAREGKAKEVIDGAVDGIRFVMDKYLTWFDRETDEMRKLILERLDPIIDAVGKESEQMFWLSVLKRRLYMV